MKKQAYILALIVLSTFLSLTPPAKTLDMYWIDVEGGAATLIVAPSGESILIDTGNPGGRDSERIFTVASQVAGLKKIDHLITTHFHRDHFGGAAELAKKIPIVNIHDKGIPENLSEDADFARNIQPYREIKAKRNVIKPDYELPLKAMPKGTAPLSLHCLGVNQQFVQTREDADTNGDCGETTDKTADTSDNANSTVFMLNFGTFTLFNGGDLTWNTEKKLVCPVNLPGEVDVYQVNHHGLDQSNNPVLVQSLSPTVAIMNNGTKKGCGPETFTSLKNTPSIQAIYQVHKNLREDGSTINTTPEKIANMEENCKANYIKLSVTPDGQQYTVSIPANSHQQVYQSKKSN